MSVVLSGGGTNAGQIIGSTTHDGAEPRERPLAPGDLLATIYHTLGVDHRQTIPEHLGREIPLIPAGRPIRELVG